jgi:phage pi2 protein 07
MTAEIHLYDKDTIDNLSFSNSEVAILVKNYWLPIMKAGSSRFIKNVNSQLLALAIDDLVLPVTVNSQELENCYVCSPYNHYVTYSKEELKTLKNSFLEKILEFIINLLGLFLNWGQINKVVIVNNLLLSTNLYPNLTSEEIHEITKYLQEGFPKHTIIFRSINTFINDELFNVFKNNGYHMIGSRQIYLFNSKDQSTVRTKMRWRLKQDFKLIQQQGYEVIDSSQISLEEIPRLVELYNALYLEKYSYHNPQFSDRFLEMALENKALQIKALRKEGKIDGVIGFYEINGIMTTPILGYDTTIPQEVGLYRMLSALLTVEAIEKGIILHQSSGAASFKRFRGFISNIEYSAVFYHHLPWRRQLVWRFLGVLVNKMAVPLMKKYKL